jgi:hypothetical protein
MARDSKFLLGSSSTNYVEFMTTQICLGVPLEKFRTNHFLSVRTLLTTLSWYKTKSGSIYTTEPIQNIVVLAHKDIRCKSILHTPNSYYFLDMYVISDTDPYFIVVQCQQQYKT